jgi:signal transduction histidine kinase
MFKHLRTSTKLFILCATFLASVGVPVYGLVAEKQIAIAFAGKELAGSSYLVRVRELYHSILALSLGSTKTPASLEASLAELTRAEAAFAGMGRTVDLAKAVEVSLLQLWSSGAEHEDALIAQTLSSVQVLAQRVGDDSNLTLDPDLDTYYLQDIVTKKLPSYFGRLWALHQFLNEGARPTGSLMTSNTGLPILEGLLRTAISEIGADLAAAYRGNADGLLPQAVGNQFSAMHRSTDAYLVSFADGQGAALAVAPSRAVLREAIDDAMAAWKAAHSELDRLLQQRVDGLLGRMQLSLAWIAGFVGLSLLTAIMTYRGIVRPLQRLESVASAVSRTKDYSLRAEPGGRDEIGRVTSAINDMLAELAAARMRETAMQTQFARNTRLTTMGEMAASIAHEINQPLAAVVANTSAALRWLGNTPPDFDRVNGVLHSIARDGRRASQVITGIRALFNKNVSDVTAIGLAGAVREVQDLLWAELEKEQVLVDALFPDDLPPVWANRVQLQQVISNLMMNAVDAMRDVVGRPRQLRLRVELNQPDAVVLTLADSGNGIAPGDEERIFDAFFSTKPSGLGLGLSICRSIVEAHGGRLWATPSRPHGTRFHVQLPTEAGKP